MRSAHLDSKCLDDPERIFNDDQLWKELEHPDSLRRASALAFVDVLAELAALRAARRKTSFLIERHHVFKTCSIVDDIRSEDLDLVQSATRVFVVALRVSAVIEADQTSAVD